MPAFNNLKQTYDYIVKQSVKALQDDVIRKVEDLLKQYTLNNLYNQFIVEEYDRTFEFLHSITITPTYKTSTGYGIEIFFDPDKMYVHILDGKWNQHADIYGNSITDKLAIWLEYGTQNDGENFYPREGAYMLRDTITFVKQSKIHIEKLKSYFKTKGILVK